MTNVSSFFIQNKGLFGGFPDNEEVLRLEEIGVRIFVDLTMYEEKKTVPYNTKYLKIKYPIKDRKIPTNWRTFAAFILKICNLFLYLTLIVFHQKRIPFFPHLHQ